MPHPLNLTAGWWLILAAFASGAVIGMGFHREDFLGGYGSFRLRLLRLGQIAFAAPGMLNVVYGLSPVSTGGGTRALLPGMLLVAGAVAMPFICLLSGELCRKNGSSEAEVVHGNRTSTKTRR